MVEIKIPDRIPDCILTRVLAEKVGRRSDISSKAYDKWGEFCEKVSGEVRQINHLFPEFTPHDEEYHLKRLFHVADTILDESLIGAMNSTELFVLAISLYGHDWGMAVSRDEKEYIITGRVPEGKSPDDLWILIDDHSRFAKFARDNKLNLDGKCRVEDIPIELWRDYVRETHALRSAERVRRFFETIDRGVADAASKVCAGHWLSFEQLQDYDSYPPDFSVLRENVNLRALAVYLRLIDLLDLAEDRTPYVIWKFVSPRDPRSKMEWEKHHALSPVTCPRYLSGRVIRVDGSTNDHEVDAALEDLRNYCEDQLRGCNDVLSRLNDENHKLDLYHIEWHVEARGFKRTSIRFEFDRDKMFRILGDEIYQGDPYVFLRELLQNSIDAIRMRRNMIQKHQCYDPIKLGVIRVNVEHKENGDAVVTWTDDGIGMDEYIVKNYLAVVGRSYYRSEEFEREGLEMDPISRFGIGILSCFMVANSIEIDTYKDSILPPQSEPLRIKIPDSRRQFRIETLPHLTANKVGTTVRVFVDGNKIPDLDEKKRPFKPLNVTEYLSTVAGFVEFPIVITEGDQKTIIIHPCQDGDAARKLFGVEFKVHKLDLSYPWSEAIVPQDLNNACKLLKEERYDIASDFGLEEYEGILTYLVPIRDDVDIDNNEAFVQGRRSGQKVRLANRILAGLSRSSVCDKYLMVFRDGILLPTTSFKYRSFRVGGIGSKLVINLKSKNTSRIDLARTRLLDFEDVWYKPIITAHNNKLLGNCLSELLSLEPQRRFYQMIRICLYHGIDPMEMWEIFPHDYWVIPFLGDGGQLKFLELREVRKSYINLMPDNFKNFMDDIIFESIVGDRYVPLSQWKGGQTLISFNDNVFTIFTNFGRIASDLTIIPFNKSHKFTSIRFVQSPWGSDKYLIQKVLSPVEISTDKPNFKELLEKMKDDPSSLNPVERETFIAKTDTPEFAEFPEEFNHYIAYGWRMLNLRNPVVQTFIRIVASFELSKMTDTMSVKQIGYFEDVLSSISDILLSRNNIYEFSKNLKAILSTAREMKLIDPGDYEVMIPTKEDFVPGSLHAYYHEINLEDLRSNKLELFGNL